MWGLTSETRFYNKPAIRHLLCMLEHTRTYTFYARRAQGAHTRTAFTLMQNHQSSQPLPWGQFYYRHTGCKRISFFRRGARFCVKREQRESPSSSAPLSSKSYRVPPFRLPHACFQVTGSVACHSHLIASCVKVTAHERDLSSPLPAAPRQTRDSTWGAHWNTFGKSHSCAGLKWNFTNQFRSWLCKKNTKEPKTSEVKLGCF